MDFKTALKLGLLAGSFFGMGFWVAKLAGARAAIPKPAEQTLEQRQAEYERIQEKLKLSYYDDLSKQPRRAAFEAEISPATSEGPKGEVPAPAALDKESDAQAEASQPAPKVEEPKPSSAHLANALSKVLGKETPDAVETAAKASLPSQTGSPFAVQVASLPDRKVAEELANRLSNKGYDARLVQADIPGRGLVYRVRIHGYDTRADADAARAGIAKAEKLDAITVAQ